MWVVNFYRIKIFIIFLVIFLIFEIPVEGIAKKIKEYKFYKGYDPNTEILMRGKIKNVWISPDTKMVIIEIKRDNKIYKSLFGSEVLKNQNFKLTPEKEVIIKGSKFLSEKGETFIIPDSIFVIDENRTYYFRR